METKELANELRNMLMCLAHINDCFLLHKKLLTYKTEMNAEMNIAPAFFQIVMYSLEHTYMVDLFKLYDRDGNAKGLRKAINLCEQHSTIFPKERIMFRDTEHNYNEVVKINVIKDIKEIRKKLDLIDPVVNSLKGRRNNYYAHADKAYVDNLPKLASDYPLSFKQVADMIRTANEILNTLLRDLCGEAVAESSTNYDDVKNIFEILKVHQKS